MRFLGLVTLLVVMTQRPAPGQEPRRDLYGDPLPDGAVARIGTTRLRNVTEISRLSLSPDGKLLVTSGDHTSLQVWDTATGALVRQLKHPPREKPDRLFPEATQEGLSTFNFGPSARKLYAVTATGRVLTCDVTTGEWGPVLARAEQVANQSGLTWAHRTGDGTRFFYQPSMGLDHRIPIVVLSAEHPRPTHTLSLAKYSRPRTLTADGRFLAAIDGDRAVNLWDLTTDELVFCRRAPVGRMFDGTVSPDGTIVVAVCGPKHQRLYGESAPPGTTLYAWDTATAKELYRSRDWEGHSVQFSPDGSRFISLLGREVLVGDARTGRLVHRLRGHGGWGIVNFSFSADCTRLATGGDDHTAIVWDLTTGKAVLDFDSPRGPVSVVAVSPDGSTVLTGCTGDSTVGLWDAATGRRRHRLSTNDRGGTTSAVFTPDGRHVVVGHGTNGRNTGLAWSARLWSVADGKLVREYGGHTDGVQSLTVSADGKQLVTRDGGGKVRAWELDSGRRTHEIESGANELFTMTFTKAGELIGVSSTRTRETEVRNLLAGTTVGKWTTPDRVNGNVLSPDGRFVLVHGSDYESRLTLRETATGKVVRTFGSRSPSGARVVTFSPDGHTFAIINFEGRDAVTLFETATGRECGTVKGHLGWVAGVAFSPDGRRLVTGGWDTTALVWDRPGVPQP